MSGDDLAALLERLGSERKAEQRRAADEAAALARTDDFVAVRLRELLGGKPEPSTSPSPVPPHSSLVVSSPAHDPPGFRLRWGAAFALSLRGEIPSAALPTLLEALGADDGDLRWSAAELLKTLARNDPAAAVVAAVMSLAGSGSPAQRRMAVYLLRDLEVRDAAALAVVEQALTAVEPGVRLAALSALPRLTEDRAAAAARIVSLVADPEAGVRRAAVVALGRLGEGCAAVLAALHGCAQSDDDSLRRAARRSLEKLGAGG